MHIAVKELEVFKEYKATKKRGTIGFFRPATLILLGLSLSACSTARLDELERQTRSDISDMRGLQAETTVTLNQIRSEINTLRGQVEELQYTSQGRTKEIEQTLQRLNTRMPPPAGVPEDLLSTDEERIARISGPAADSYKSGLGLLRAGDFEAAAQRFAAFVSENPGTAFTDNGLFWQGIAYSKLGQYDRAIVSFTEVFQRYPAEDMVAPSLFFLAECFEKTGSPEDAQLTLQKLIEEFPRSSYAAQAKPLLKPRGSGRGRR